MKINLEIATHHFNEIANMTKKNRFPASVISEPSSFIDSDSIHSRLFGVEGDWVWRQLC